MGFEIVTTLFGCAAGKQSKPFLKFTRFYEFRIFPQIFGLRFVTYLDGLKSEEMPQLYQVRDKKGKPRVTFASRRLL